MRRDLKSAAGVVCLLIVLGMGAFGLYESGRSEGREDGYREGREAGIIVGACVVVKTMRPDLDWQKDCQP